MTEDDLRQLIDDEIEESLTVEYKAAGALARTNEKKSEVTKDVSAMANSAGGRIIYGIQEHSAAQHRHKPQQITPIDSASYSKEWLEQVIAQIQPRIENLRIIPVRLASGDSHVAYVVDIPMSNTAHQATDRKYLIGLRTGSGQFTVVNP